MTNDKRAGVKFLELRELSCVWWWHPQQLHATRFKMVYIRQDKLSKLKEYKYSGVDHSMISRYVLKPFYTKVVINFFPMSMA